MYVVMNKQDNKNEEVCSLIKGSNIIVCDKIKKIIKESNGKQKQMSYSDIVKKSIEMPNLSKQISLQRNSGDTNRN